MSYARVHEVEDVVALAESEKAVLCRLPDDRKVWVPKSQIDELSDVKERGDEGMLTVRWWWAEKAGLVA